MKIGAAFVLLFLMLFVPSLALADLGPKPTMDFSFVFDNVSRLEIIDGLQMQCNDIGCLDPKPLAHNGPQSFGCSMDKCSSLAYGYAPYNKLVIHFADKVRESNVFTTGTS